MPRTSHTTPLVTVAIPTKNEASSIAECIASARHLGPVIVIDSHSNDSTSEIASRHGAQVVFFNWNGKFPKKRNWLLRTHCFQTEWILFLDADELVTEAFTEEIHRTLPQTTHNAFWLQFDNYFLGKRLRWGDSFSKLSLMRIGSGEYECIPDSRGCSLDMEVHEHPTIAGTTGRICSRLIHNDQRGLFSYIEKHNEYSTWEATRFTVALSDPKSDDGVKLTSPTRQSLKYKLLQRWWFAPGYFAYSYFVKMGLLDGYAGLHFALFKAIYFYQTRLKIRENSRNRTGTPFA